MNKFAGNGSSSTQSSSVLSLFKDKILTKQPDTMMDVVGQSVLMFVSHNHLYYFDIEKHLKSGYN